jgi:acylphosphatase
MPSTITRQLRITGRVQGVGFRYEWRELRANWAVTGWVRNRRDGTVEATVSGTAMQIEEIIAWARHGPSTARVTGVAIVEASGDFASFGTWPTE